MVLSLTCVPGSYTATYAGLFSFAAFATATSLYHPKRDEISANRQCFPR